VYSFISFDIDDSSTNVHNQIENIVNCTVLLL
jgi:hypothetical protein